VVRASQYIYRLYESLLFTDLNNFNSNGNFSCDGCEWSDFRDRNDVDINVQRVLFTLNWRFGGFGATTAAAY